MPGANSRKLIKDCTKIRIRERDVGEFVYGISTKINKKHFIVELLKRYNNPSIIWECIQKVILTSLHTLHLHTVVIR